MFWGGLGPIESFDANFEAGRVEHVCAAGPLGGQRVAAGHGGVLVDRRGLLRLLVETVLLVL